MNPLQSFAVTGRSVNAVTDFGATVNGGGDDTKQLQNALNYLATNLIADAGVCLYLPAGTYDITNRLVFSPTNPAGASQGITIRGNDSDAPSASIIRSTSTKGALHFAISVYTNTVTKITTNENGVVSTNTSLVPYDFNIQVRDIQFQAGAANAGPAIEMTKTPDTNRLQIATYMNNVKITRDNINCYYTYGIKGKWVSRPVFRNLSVLGSRPGMKAGLSLDAHYSYNIGDSHFQDMEVAVDTTRGAEGNSLRRTVITNVLIGVRMTIDMDVSGPSGSGGAIFDSNISASQIGMHVIGKQFVSVHSNVFSRWGGTGGYTNIYWDGVHKAIISDNEFVGGSNQKGIVLEKKSSYLAEDITIAYNKFGSFGTDISVGANVFRTRIINNSSILTNIVNQGTDTSVFHGPKREFYKSLAESPAVEDFRWNALAYAPIINVTNCGAKGNGTTDDTAAITNALAQLKTNLNSSGKGTLYFPAGRYKLSQRLDLTQQPGDNWQKVTICGDGPDVSIITAATTNKVFKITCTRQVPVTIHNLGFEATLAKTDSAIDLTEAGGAKEGARSAVFHNIGIGHLNGSKYFKSGVRGQGLVRPLFDQFVMETSFDTNTAPEGITLNGGYGADFTGGKIGHAIRPCTINSLGGAVNISGGTLAGSGVTGLVVNAGGGTFALYAAHINSQNNLVVSNASEASYMNSETLWDDPFVEGQVTETLRFSNCTNIHIRDCFLNSSGTVLKPDNSYIVLQGNKNRNVDISGNMLRSVTNAVSIGLRIDQGSTNVNVYDNRFVENPFTVDILNYSGTNATVSMLPLDVRPELAGYWDLNENRSSTAYGRCYVQNGAIFEAAWTNAGKYDSGLKFDGVNDAVNTATPQFKEIMSNFTMMAWVKPEKAISGGTRSPTQSYVFTLLNGDELSPNGVTNIHRGVALSVGINEIRVVEHGTISSGWDTLAKITWAVNLPPTVWTHVAVTYSNCVPRLYIDGVLKATGTNTVGKIPHPGCNFGGSPAWGPYKGYMDEMRVLNRTLSASEIGTEMNKRGIN
ncbi:MAG: LamG-like jellyroll fold domain-containing protein [Kiritimatiellales bacterium]